MSWVKDALTQLETEGVARVRPGGGSMRGRIESGQLVTLVPATIAQISAGDIVFVRWKGNYLLHLAVEVSNGRILIGNNLGKINGWVPAAALIAKATAVAD